MLAVKSKYLLISLLLLIVSCGVDIAGKSNDLSPLFTLVAPENLTATALTSTKVRLDWDDMSDEENYYRVYRALGDADLESISHVGKNIETFTDRRLIPGATYRYRIETKREGYWNPPLYSNVSSVTMPTSADGTLPQVAEVSQASELVDENIYTIRGRNFGIKDPAPPIRWLHFQNGQVSDPPDLTNTLIGWDAGEMDVDCRNGFCPHYNNAMPRFPGDIGLKQTYQYHTDGDPENDDSVQNQMIGIYSDSGESNPYGDPIPNPFYWRVWVYRENVRWAQESTNQKLYGNFGSKWYPGDDNYANQCRVVS